MTLLSCIVVHRSASCRKQEVAARMSRYRTVAVVLWREGKHLPIYHGDDCLAATLTPHTHVLSSATVAAAVFKVSVPPHVLCRTYTTYELQHLLARTEHSSVERRGPSS